MIDHSRINALKKRAGNPHILAQYRKYQMSHAAYVLKNKHGFKIKDIEELFAANPHQLIKFEERVRSRNWAADKVVRMARNRNMWVRLREFLD